MEDEIVRSVLRMIPSRVRKALTSPGETSS